MNCEKCGCEIRNPNQAWLQYVGWARPRSQRGQNSGSSLIGREPTGKLMCQGCATRLEYGITESQETLV
jgi:hypothetical protein